MDTRRTYCWGESLPEDHGDEAQYEYHPRPPGVHSVQNPPITRNDFQRYLTTCKHPCWWSHVPFMKHRCARPHKDSHKWKRIPKRKAFMAEQPGDVAYGIEAAYALSALMMFSYHAIPLLGWGGFSFWWLRHHPEDLQNAFVPPVMLLALFAAFWSYPGHGQGTHRFPK